MKFDEGEGCHLLACQKVRDQSSRRYIYFGISTSVESGGEGASECIPAPKEHASWIRLKHKYFTDTEPLKEHYTDEL